MTSEISFALVLEKYFIYSEVFSQYNKLEDEDRVIVEPYLETLKQAWQEELQTIESQLYIPLSVRIIWELAFYAFVGVEASALRISQQQ